MMVVYMAPNREIAERVASSGSTMAGPHSMRPACTYSCEPARWVEENEHETERHDSVEEVECL